MTEKPAETVTVEFAVGMGDGQYKASVAVPAGRTNLTQILPILQSLDSSLINGIAAQATQQSNQAISCKAGCGACCRQVVPISIFEAELLADWIRTLPEDQQQILADRFHDALTRLAATGILDRMADVDWQTEAGRKLALEYFYTGVPCPFLQDESCSIHPIRPLICREFLVVSPPENCADPANRQTVHVRMPINFSRILNDIGREVEKGPRGWIPLVFLFAWMKSGARPGEAVSGTGPEVLYEFVRRMGKTDDAPQPAAAPPAGDAEA